METKEFLSISIPTRNRCDYLSDLLTSIKVQFPPLRGRELVKVYIWNNASTDNTLEMLNGGDWGFDIEYIQHPENIGANSNINHAYTHTKGEYTWVIGDDEVLPNGALSAVLDLLSFYKPGLLLTKDSSYEMANPPTECYSNYEEFAKFCKQNQPHILIAHSLISCNIIRTELYDNEIYKDKHPSCYSNFYAVINGAIKGNLPLVFAQVPTISVRDQRAPFEDADSTIYTQIYQEQLRYVEWVNQRLRLEKCMSVLSRNCPTTARQVDEMIAVQVEGPLHRQLSQYAFGLSMAGFDTSALRCQFSGEALVCDLLGGACAIGDEVTLSDVRGRNHVTCPESYLPGDRFGDVPQAFFVGGWTDARYWCRSAPKLREMYKALPVAPWADANWGSLAALSSAAVIDLRDGAAMVSVSYVREAVAALREATPDAMVVVVCTNADVAQRRWGLPLEYKVLEVDGAADELALLRFFASFSLHIVTNTGLSMWGAVLGASSPRSVVAPMQLDQRVSHMDTPVWPEDWLILPPRIDNPHTKPIAEFAGAVRQQRPIRVGVSGCYENLTRQGHLFRNMSVANGHNSLKPWCDLHAYGQLNGIEFLTLDQVEDVTTDIDALVLLDRPKSDNVLSAAAMQADILKILIIYECPLIKPENWDASYHTHFDYIFTWEDGLVDGRRYIKNNFVTDLGLPHDFQVLQAAFAQRKLLTMVNSSVLLSNPENFPTQLYTHRIRAIRWFEANAKDDFDLYGMGWDGAAFPSYKGHVSDKLATLTHYRFALVYENAQGYAGYISEKIQDCLLAGVVPVYGGAPNIAQWIPSDCYIGINQFKTFDDMHAFLRDMPAEVHASYLDRIRSFFTSGKAYPFSTECFVSTLTRYLAWGVQQRRSEPVAGYGEPLSAQTHYLYQEPGTLGLTPMPRQPAAKGGIPSLPTASRAGLRTLQAPNMIVSVGYGPELPVFTRVRALWDFYASHFPGVKVIFIRDSFELPSGEVRRIGGDLVFGIGGSKWDRQNPNSGQTEGYAVTGVWSSEQNERTIHRQMALYRYLLALRSDDFHLFSTTITSVVDFRGLLELLPLLPSRRCYAGLPGTLQHVPYQGVGIVHGGNTLVSSDVMELMLQRYVPGHIDVQQPNDHWQGIVLKDVPRVTLPLFSFNEARRVGTSMDEVYALTQRLLADGHYHFRVKTCSAQPGVELREDVDPWLMLRVMQAVLDGTPEGSRTIALQKRFALACAPGLNISRDFPIDDSETQHFYQL